MKNKIIKISFLSIFGILILAMLISAGAKFVFLSPSCYDDASHLDERENYFIKKVVLEAVEDRLSLFFGGENDIYDNSATEDEVIVLDQSAKNRKHILIFINTDFMDSVTKTDDGYTILVQTHLMEKSADCVYEIRLSKDFEVTFFGLDA